MKYLLDTCVISELTKPVPNSDVISWLNSIDADKLFISVITIGEIQKGLSKLSDIKKKKKLTEWLNTLLDKYQDRLISIDLKVAEKWGFLLGNSEKKGVSISSIDGLLAATVYTHNLTLVTRNESDFIHVDIPVFNPWQT